MTRPERREGAAWLRIAYAYWRQVLIFFDLAGEDGRPSITKLAGLAVLAVMLYICARTLSVPGGAVTLIVCVFAVFFGRQTFRFFLSRYRASSHSENIDTTNRSDVKAVEERRQSLEYERTP